MTTDAAPGARRISRRDLLVGGAAAGGVAALGAIGGFELAGLAGQSGRSGANGSAVSSELVPFDGVHQAGILTPAQDRLAFAAFDMTSTGRDALVSLLKSWTVAARAMAAGRPVGDVGGALQQPPVDTGEAFGLATGRLTITVGFGPSLFDSRFGLAGRRPAALVDLPSFPGDILDPTRGGGDLCIQACSDDPQVAFHAVRNLARLGRNLAEVRWFQLGFGRTSLTSAAQVTPRNLMGFKDGTNNIVSENKDDVDRFVWAAGDDQAWITGGSYLVARRIRMRIESWDRASLAEQERIFGRHKVNGAPLGAASEHDAVNLDAHSADGSLVIADDAHIRLAAPASNAGQRILRRGYSFTDGMDPRTGELDAGLFFICYQSDPRQGFIPVQARLAAQDSLNEYIRHTGSALFACPPGTAGPDDYWGSALVG
jgi:deferrochelatase/peroxidase EfeB